MLINKKLALITIVLFIPHLALHAMAGTEIRKAEELLNKELFALLQKENASITQISELIAQGANVNAIHRFDTPLIYATRNNRTDICELLITKGALVNTLDRNGCSALHEAARRGFEDLCKLFLLNGADVNAIDRLDSATALFLAAQNGHAATCKLLLAHGANVNAKNQFGHTPLIYTLIKECLEASKILIENGADVDVFDTLDRSTPLIKAAANGFLDMCALLIEKHADVNACNNKQSTPLCLAALAGHLSVCVLLIDKGAKVNPEAYDSPLTCAAAGGHSEICTLLIDKGANINATGILDWAAIRGHTDIFTLLVSKGAKMSPENLILAAGHGRYEICEFLIKKGANVNEMDRGISRNSALHQAAAGGYTKVCKLLIDNGARVKEKSKLIHSNTPLLEAAAGGHTEVCKLLIDNGADVDDSDNEKNSSLHKASAGGDTETCKLLIARGANVNAKNKKGLTPLFYATGTYRFEESGRRNDDICMLLVQNGALIDVDRKDVPPNLFWAIDNKLFKVGELLIEKGANVNEKNEKGVFPLHRAAAEGLDTLCQLLIEKGADVNAAATDGKVALIAAGLSGHSKVCTILQKEMIHQALKSSINATDCRGRFRTAFLIFKRFLAGNYKNLGLVILAKNPELEKELLTILYNAHYKKTKIDASCKKFLQTRFVEVLGKTSFLEPIKMVMKEAIQNKKYRHNRNLAKALQPNSLEENIKQILQEC